MARSPAPETRALACGRAPPLQPTTGPLARSRELTRSSRVKPASICPGHRTINGTCNPESSTDLFAEILAHDPNDIGRPIGWRRVQRLLTLRLPGRSTARQANRQGDQREPAEGRITRHPGTPLLGSKLATLILEYSRPGENAAESIVALVTGILEKWSIVTPKRHPDGVRGRVDRRVSHRVLVGHGIGVETGQPLGQVHIGR